MYFTMHIVNLLLVNYKVIFFGGYDEEELHIPPNIREDDVAERYKWPFFIVIEEKSGLTEILDTRNPKD